jgi:glycosyltransferase involved in cell wall biosynthesis
VLFSVVIPTYNRARLLKDTLDSVLRQEFTDFEVIIVDDGSTDETRNVIAGYQGRVRYVRQDNAGPGAARNLGIQHASGDYIAFVDSDDLWFPWTLDTAAHAVFRCGRPAIISTNGIDFCDPAELAMVMRRTPEMVRFPDYYASHASAHSIGAGMAVLRKNDVVRAGAFSDRRMNGEDHDLILRMGMTHGFVQILGPTTVACRRHSGNVTRDLGRTVTGIRYLIERERSNGYPGGEERATQRRGILTRHVRPVSFECVRRGFYAEGWRLYKSTFAWHLKLGRWKYLVGFPLKLGTTRICISGYTVAGEGQGALPSLNTCRTTLRSLQ